MVIISQKYVVSQIEFVSSQNLTGESKRRLYIFFTPWSKKRGGEFWLLVWFVFNTLSCYKRCITFAYIVITFKGGPKMKIPRQGFFCHIIGQHFCQISAKKDENMLQTNWKRVPHSSKS